MTQGPVLRARRKEVKSRMKNAVEMSEKRNRPKVCPARRPLLALSEPFRVISLPEASK